MYGNFELLESIEEKLLSTFRENNLPSTKNYAQYMFETYDNMNGAVATLLVVERYAQADSLLKAAGFCGWDKESFSNVEMLLTAFKTVFVGIDEEKDMVWFRLAMFLAAPKGSIDESEVNIWMPTPAALAEMERTYPYFSRLGLYEVKAVVVALSLF